MNAPARDVEPWFKHWAAVVLSPLTFLTVAAVVWPWVFSWWQGVSGLGGFCIMVWVTLICLGINVIATVLVYGTLTDMSALDLRLPESVRKLAESYRVPSSPDSSV